MHTLTKLQAERHDTELRERSKKNHRALLTQILGMRKELGLSSMTMTTHCHWERKFCMMIELIAHQMGQKVKLRMNSVVNLPKVSSMMNQA